MADDEIQLSETDLAVRFNPLFDDCDDRNHWTDMKTHRSKGWLVLDG
jgi:hypothetical protein